MSNGVNVNSRFQLSNAPVNEPGRCSCCGASKTDDRKYVDTGVTLDFYGTVYFCTFCMTEIGSVIGLIHEKDLAELKFDLEGTKAALKSANDSLKHLGDFYASVRDIVPVVANSNLGPDGSYSSFVANGGSHAEGTGEEGQNNSDPDVFQQVEGISDVRSTTESPESGAGSRGTKSEDISIDDLLK